MTTDAIEDYLTKELYIERNVVTYRSLSRAQRIHVNVAKNELANYLKNGSQKAFATYLISGVPKEQDNDAMDVDTEGEPNLEYSGGDSDVPQTRMVIVGDNELEDTKVQFARINAIHVYSLSPSTILDSGHLCAPTVDVVRPVDKQQGPEFAAVVGRIVGKHVSTKLVKRPTRPENVAGPSKINRPKPPPDLPAPPKEKTGSKSEQPQDKPKDKPKATGKLDFSKAKVKVKEEVKVEPKKEKVASSSTAAAKEKKSKVEAEKPRGTKRKSTTALMSDSEDEKEKPKKEKEKEKVTTKSSKGKAPALASDSEADPQSVRPGRVQKKEVVPSDDDGDDDDDGPRIYRRKSKALAKLGDKLEEHMNKEIQDMMDIDDEQVIRHRRPDREVFKKEEEEEEEEQKEEAQPNPPVREDEDVEMDDPAPRKKRTTKPKKVVPVGRNGLKKKRVVKSRMKTEGGMMVVEDYSEYESVDEEEPEPPKKSKSKAKSTAASKKASEDSDAATGPSKTTATSKKVAEEESDSTAGPSKAKAANKKSSKPVKGNTKSGQQGIASFFGKGPR